MAADFRPAAIHNCAVQTEVASDEAAAACANDRDKFDDLPFDGGWLESR
jgi:hypothetical protein